MRQITHIVIHCSATSQTATVEAIQRYWREKLGWRNPGYHKIILPNGSVRTLADDSQVCNGVRGHNATSLHICYLGGVDTRNRPIDNRTEAQNLALVKELLNWAWKYKRVKILGHRDFPNVAKACPSFDVNSWLKSINFKL